MKVRGAYHGWWVVFCAFVVALYGWGLGFYGLSLYLVALTKAHGWSPATVSSAITFYYVAGAFLVMEVGDVPVPCGVHVSQHCDERPWFAAAEDSPT